MRGSFAMPQRAAATISAVVTRLDEEDGTFGRPRHPLRLVAAARRERARRRTGPRAPRARPPRDRPRALEPRPRPRSGAPRTRARAGVAGAHRDRSGTP